MKRRDFMRMTAAGAIGMTTSLGSMSGLLKAQQPHPAGVRPNVLLIMLDDAGYSELSCHGNPHIKTPNIDKFAGQSVRFSDFHAAPMCTPTRSQLLTGRDAYINGAFIVASNRTHMKTEFPTIAELFRAEGYATGMFGKWHIGDNYPMRPMDRGFDESYWFPQAIIGSIPDYWGNDYYDDKLLNDDQREQEKGYCTDYFFARTMKWMEKCAQDKKPFFGFMPLNAAHAPFIVPQKYLDMYKQIEDPNTRHHYAMMASVDENMGQLDSFLAKSGLADNTIVIFTSDNGTCLKYPLLYDGGIRGRKHEYYEGGHRVPCFVRWPNGNLRPAGEIGGVTQVQDLLPTLMDLCGLQGHKKLTLDGASLAAVLQGKAEVPERMLVVRFGPLAEGGMAVMWSRWRLVVDNDKKPEEQRVELYNLDQDPKQQTDVSAQNPEIVQKLKAHYEQWQAKVGPGLATAQPIIIGNDAENPLTMTSASWVDRGVTGIEPVVLGKPMNGVLQVRVDRDGDYKFELRRWPAETNGTLRGVVPPIINPHQQEILKVVELTPVALPISKAVLEIADQKKTRPVGDQDQAAVFDLPLKKGLTTVKGTFLDEKDKELCGAFYVTVTRK